MTVRLNLQGRNIVLRLDNDILKEAWRGSTARREWGYTFRCVCAFRTAHQAAKSASLYLVMARPWHFAKGAMGEVFKHTPREKKRRLKGGWVSQVYGRQRLVWRSVRAQLDRGPSPFLIDRIF